jgi:hypothetical protein
MVTSAGLTPRTSARAGPRDSNKSRVANLQLYAKPLREAVATTTTGGRLIPNGRLPAPWLDDPAGARCLDNGRRPPERRPHVGGLVPGGAGHRPIVTETTSRAQQARGSPDAAIPVRASQRTAPRGATSMAATPRPNSTTSRSPCRARSRPESSARAEMTCSAASSGSAVPGSS